MLPDYIPATNDHPAIKLIIYTPISVSYHTVHEIVPGLLERYQPDFVLHMGLHGGRPSFDLEKSAPRTGFQFDDVNGKRWSLDKKSPAIPGIKVEEAVDTSSFPDRLETKAEYEEIIKLWKDSCLQMEEQVTGNDGVGSFCCGFVYYTSLAWFRKQDPENGPALFLHMPNLQEEKELEMGSVVVVKLLESIAATL